MMTLTSEEFACDPKQWVEQTVQEHGTIVIESEIGRAVMISEEDWNSINDILQVVSMSGMAESIRSGLQDEIDLTAENID